MLTPRSYAPSQPSTKSFLLGGDIFSPFLTFHNSTVKMDDVSHDVRPQSTFSLNNVGNNLEDQSAGHLMNLSILYSRVSHELKERKLGPRIDDNYRKLIFILISLLRFRDWISIKKKRKKRIALNLRSWNIIRHGI